MTGMEWKRWEKSHLNFRFADNPGATRKLNTWPLQAIYPLEAQFPNLSDLTISVGSLIYSRPSSYPRLKGDRVCLGDSDERGRY
jgi:hypothetical protein